VGPVPWANTRLPRPSSNRHHLGHEPPQGLVAGEVPQPQDELRAAGVDEGLGLLGHLLGRAHQVVGQVAVDRRPPPHRLPPSGSAHQARASASVSKSRQSGPWVRVMASGTADLLAVAGQQRRLAHEGLQAHLPVGGVGVAGGDAQVHLLAAAADQHRRQGCWTGLGSQ
jgi:hypothetical protein